MKSFLLAVTTLGAAGFSQAAILSISNLATATAEHSDSNLGVVYTTTQSGANLSAPLLNQTTTVGAHSYTTEGYYSSGVTTNTPTLVQVDGYLAGTSEFGGSFAAGQGLAYAEIFTTNTLTFTLDSPGTVTLRNYDVGTTVLGGPSPMYFTASLILDGITYHTAATDGIYTLPVAAGVHTASYEQTVAAWAFGTAETTYNASGLMQSYHQILVSSVPEPSTAMAWVLGAALLLRTRRRLAD